MKGHIIQIANPFGIVFPIYIADKEQKWVDVVITNINLKEDKILFNYNAINTLNYDLVLSPTFCEIAFGFQILWRFKE